MLYIITPCSRPENLEKIQQTIPSEARWIICHDKKTDITPINNAITMICNNTGMVGTQARNHVLDNFPFKDEDHLLFHDDDNIIHPLLYENVKNHFEKDFSIMCWGQVNKDNSIRLYPTYDIRVGNIDTASFLIKWKFNKHVRHRIDIYEHDGIYANQCAMNGGIIVLDGYLCYYNYLR